MGRRHFTRILDVPLGGMLPALVVLGAAFLLGGLIGCGLAASVGGGANDSLATYIQNYMAAAKAGITQPPELLPLVWEVVRWPLFALLLGFTALGVIGVPLLFFARGFLISFAVTSFVRMFGAAGGGLAFLFFGLTGLLAIPVLFVLGVQSFLTAIALAGRSRNQGKRLQPLYGRAFLVRCGICAAVLALCVLLEYFALPILLGALAGRFSI